MMPILLKFLLALALRVLANWLEASHVLSAAEHDDLQTVVNRCTALCRKAGKFGVCATPEADTL